MLTRRAFVHGMLWLPPVLIIGTSCSGSSPSVTVSLDYDSPVPLGGTMAFRLTALSRYDRPRPQEAMIVQPHVYFNLQDGLTPAAPLDPQWIVSPLHEHATSYHHPVTFKAFISQTFVFHVRIDQAGDRALTGGIGQLQGSSFTDVASTTLYLRITTEGTQIQRTPFSPTT